MKMKGLVVKNTGSWYHVETDAKKIVECKIKGNFRLKGIRTTNPIAVGDKVEFDLNAEGYGMISKIEDRKNYIIRKASNLSKQSHIIAANVDQVFLLVTVNYPEVSTSFIDRFLATSEAYNVPAHLIFNKIDLYTEPEAEYMRALMYLYDSLGYPCHTISAKDGFGIDELRSLIQNKVTLFSGYSGVGKSTFINALLPDIHAKVGAISHAHNKGMHTTTFSEMFFLKDGGYLIDTPGVKGFGTFDIKKEEAGHYFPEIFKVSKTCRFANCTHTHEPGCAVLEAVDRHEISLSRYQSYVSIMDDSAEGRYR
jgi:ribosome biogenesis GTPase / thiamine phosphate phosphatase